MLAKGPGDRREKLDDRLVVLVADHRGAGYASVMTAR